MEDPGRLADPGRGSKVHVYLEKLGKETGWTAQELEARLLGMVPPQPWAVVPASQWLTPARKPSLGLTSPSPTPSPVPVKEGRGPARPVSWSLHKFFQPKAGPVTASPASSSPGQGEELVLTGQQGGRAMQEEQAAEQKAVSEVLQLVPTCLEAVVQRPARKHQCQRGGRPRKVVCHARGKYLKRLSARQKLEFRAQKFISGAQKVLNSPDF